MPSYSHSYTDSRFYSNWTWRPQEQQFIDCDGALKSGNDQSGSKVKFSKKLRKNSSTRKAWQTVAPDILKVGDKTKKSLADTSASTSLPGLSYNFVKTKSEACENFYAFNEFLGRGRFGRVYRCVEKDSGTEFAAKCLRCKKPVKDTRSDAIRSNTASNIDTSNKENILLEIAIMNQINHPNIVKLYDAYESDDSMTLILEYVNGGELFERVIDGQELTERDAALYTKEIVKAVQYLHSNFILHLDLKPENILCVNRTTHQIKVIDFGFARKFSSEHEQLHVKWGTPEFMAPETLSRNLATSASDMWSVGVVAYILLSGLSPFAGSDPAEVIKNIITCNWDFNDDVFDFVSHDAKDFVFNLLTKNENDRLSAVVCIRHNWLTTPPSGKKTKKSALEKLVTSWKDNLSIAYLANWIKQKLSDLKKVIRYTSPSIESPIVLPSNR